jgi:hypothetical protein
MTSVLLSHDISSNTYYSYFNIFTTFDLNLVLALTNFDTYFDFILLNLSLSTWHRFFPVHTFHQIRPFLCSQAMDTARNLGNKPTESNASNQSQPSVSTASTIQLPPVSSSGLVTLPSQRHLPVPELLASSNPLPHPSIATMRQPPTTLSGTSSTVTYTPTTHRVSKAKKGKRVHACEFPGCNKVSIHRYCKVFKFEHISNL